MKAVKNIEWKKVLYSMTYPISLYFFGVFFYSLFNVPVTAESKVTIWIADGVFNSYAILIPAWTNFPVIAIWAFVIALKNDILPILVALIAIVASTIGIVNFHFNPFLVGGTLVVLAVALFGRIYYGVEAALGVALVAGIQGSLITPVFLALVLGSIIGWCTQIVIGCKGIKFFRAEEA